MTPQSATETMQVMNQARDALVEILVVRADAPNRVRAAYRLGIRKEEIHRLSGLARSTIDRYLEHQP